MQAYISNKQTWHETDGDSGTEFSPAEDITASMARDGYNGKVYSQEQIEGYGARLTMPGYMDCTEWAVFETVKQAAEYLLETYFQMADDEMSEQEAEDYKGLMELVNAA